MQGNHKHILIQIFFTVKYYFNKSFYELFNAQEKFFRSSKSLLSILKMPFTVITKVSNAFY